MMRRTQKEARCAKCGAPKWRHCEFDEPGLDHPADCDRMHHEFQDRRRALWNRHCRCGAPTANLCACIDTCVCGDLRVAHEYDYSADQGAHHGACETPGCGCPRFELDEEAAGAAVG